MNLSFKIQAACLCLIIMSAYSQLHAGTCAKCSKIEAERANEQAKSDYEKNEYYDDYIKKHEKEQSHLNDKEKNSDAAVNNQELSLSALSLHDSLSWLAALEADQSSSLNGEKRGEEFLDNASSTSGGTNTKALSADEKYYVQAPHSSSVYSTVADILSIRSFMDVFKNSFTILAPSDEAIKHFPSIAFDKALEPENRELLFSYITNHIIPHQILKQDFDKSFKTLGGRNIEFQSTENGITINGDAKVVKSIALGDKGILYVIDRVLIPIHN